MLIRMILILSFLILNSHILLLKNDKDDWFRGIGVYLPDYPEESDVQNIVDHDANRLDSLDLGSLGLE